VIRVEEKNYFFRMSAFQQRLIAHIEANPDWIIPAARKNEVLGFLRKPLEDLSISRPRSRVSWGIPLPFDPEHVTYVWVDALYNYVTASGQIEAENEPATRGFGTGEGPWWPADLHLIGKDIITTHAVYWPTLLMGADLPLPRQILAHGWWVVGDTKMSKSLGNVVDPLELRAEFGTDAVRWYLMREMPTGGDASYTPDRFLTRYEELANVLGNLASRSIAMIARYREGRVPASDALGLTAEIERTYEDYHQEMLALRIHEALGSAMDLARSANGYVEEREPWAQAKDPGRSADLDDTLATLYRVLVMLCAFFQPVMPARMGELATRLGLDGVPELEKAFGVRPGGQMVRKGSPLFPKR
jgi:methionyl-tRNA synthetase